MPNISPSFIAVILSVILLASCSSEAAEPQASGEKAPDFEVTTIAGDTITLQQSIDSDKPLVIYFTASWCPTCAQNWPVLSEVYPEYKDRLTLVAISIDPTDGENVIRKLAEEKGFTFPSTRGYPQVMLDFGVDRQATTVGVNQEGYIEYRHVGAFDADEYRELFDSLFLN